MSINSQNTTDATRGMPLVQRVEYRVQELIRLRDRLPEHRRTARADLDVAISGGEALLTGDLTHVCDATAAEMNRWLEANKHLAEATPSN